jgi:glycosyltransferase
MPPHPTFFVRREIYDRLGLFDVQFRSAADYEIMLRILLKNRIPAHYMPRVIVKMRAGGMSNASFLNRVKANQEDRLAWKLNGLQPYFFTLYVKPLRKLPQFFIR